MTLTKDCGNAKVNECVNEVQTSSINTLNISDMKETNFKLDIDFNEKAETEESERVSNQPALDRVLELATNGYYFFVQPKNSKKGEAYLWIKATKQGEDREEFALYVNNVILNAVVAILIGKIPNVSSVNADDLDSFNKKVTNLEYVLFIAERAQGRTMNKTYTTNGQKFSSYYKRGIITYMPYLNPELKAYLNA